MLNKKDRILQISALITEHKSDISKVWIDKTSVKEIFISYSISSKYFTTHYAFKIIEHFAEVMSGQQPVGNSPTMNDFIKFMFDKEITAKEIFLIFMGFRRSLFRFLTNNKLIEAKDKWLIEALSELFDKNLSSSLEYFDSLHIKKEIEKQKEEDAHIYAKRLQTILDLQEKLIFKIKDGKLYLANRAFLEAIGILDKEEFEKKYSIVWEFIKRVNRFTSLFESKNYDQWIKKLIVKYEGTCEAVIFDRRINRTILTQMKIKSLPTEESLEYVVTFDDITERKKEIHSLTQMALTDALTGAPNRRMFEKRINTAFQEFKNKDKPFFLVIIDLNKLSEINKHFGRETGDALLRSFVEETMKTTDEKHFFARVDGDQFALIVNDKEVENVKKYSEKIKSILHSIHYFKKESAEADIAIVRCQKDDNLRTMMLRAEKIIHIIQENNDSKIMDDSDLVKQEKIFKEAREKFINSCKLLLDTAKTIEIVNFYMEIPIQSDSEIIKIMEDTIWIKIRKVAFHALQRNEKVFIKRDEKPHFQARVTDFNIEKSAILISNMIPVDQSPLERRNIHVKLEPYIEAVIKYDKIQMPVFIDTVSIDSITFRTAHILNLKVSDHLLIETILRWDGKEVPITLSGSILKIKEKSDTFKIVMLLEQSKEIDETLAPYIAHRQIEIIRELQDSIL
ncbi:GGDEF domain-containing protein [Hydrogenimonas thermophila]|uniref:GGDEF domain-containing protein n=1 Tax=Hydrogenimonas thermophila TaxID=223786 RepID=UPI00293724C3|nr:GGDEF domain-containing protein [Hydrogenimonas thermophila]WOE70999.1 GGDEF domain-containing protein [Hydrogenimonas thermophila]WOE73517.1 GGDEF domain-containing protein [Hydrogenimonas thermophila]